MIIRKFLSILIIKPIIKPYITNKILKLKNSSIGKHSTSNEAVIIGNHSIVAPQFYCNKNILSYSMFGSVPTLIIRSIYDMIINHT